MKIHALTPIIAAVAYLLVGLFIYSKKKSNPVNKSFAVMLWCVSLWFVEWAGLISAPDADFARHWGNIFRIGLLFIPPTFLHFTIRFVNSQEISRGSRKILLIFYVLSCFFGLINWTRYFHGKVIASPWGITSKAALYTFFSSCNLSSLSCSPFTTWFGATLSPIVINGIG